MAHFFPVDASLFSEPVVISQLKGPGEQGLTTQESAEAPAQVCEGQCQMWENQLDVLGKRGGPEADLPEPPGLQGGNLLVCRLLGSFSGVS